MPSNDKHLSHLSRSVEEEKAEHLETMLDQALKDTFPASDPVAIDVPHEHAGTPLQPPARRKTAKTALRRREREARGSRSRQASETLR